jgi:uroporphyrinogen-III synthase
MPFAGLRVLSLESRRAAEMATLIRTQHGVPLIAPSVREVPLADNAQALEFAERLFRGEFDIVILLTGVGTRHLNQVIESRWPAGAFADALRRVSVVVRGPKPRAVMREWGVPVAAIAPEPNTWREILKVAPSVTGKQIAVQEFGRHSQELIDALTSRGAHVTPVSVYQWELPADLTPLREAVRRVAGGEIDVILLTSGVQWEHLLRIASEMGLTEPLRNHLQHTVIASIGPSTTKVLREAGIVPDFEPSHPKMGFLVTETAARAAEILAGKRTGKRSGSA